MKTASGDEEGWGGCSGIQALCGQRWKGPVPKAPTFHKHYRLYYFARDWVWLLVSPHHACLSHLPNHTLTFFCQALCTFPQDRVIADKKIICANTNMPMLEGFLSLQDQKWDCSLYSLLELKTINRISKTSLLMNCCSSIQVFFWSLWYSSVNAFYLFNHSLLMDIFSFFIFYTFFFFGEFHPWVLYLCLHDFSLSSCL